WCARADDAAASAAWVPAVGRTGPVTVAVNAGRDPRRAAELRDRLGGPGAAAGRFAGKAAETWGGARRGARPVAAGGGGARGRRGGACGGWGGGAGMEA